MNYSDMCISEPFPKAVITPTTVFPWPLTVPQTVINNHPVAMSNATHYCHPSMNGNFQVTIPVPVSVSDKPEELRPQNGIVVYYTGVPAFPSQFNPVSNNEVEKPTSGTDGGNSPGKKEKIFPWWTSFSKQCCAAVGNKSVKQLENLLNTYIQHVTPHYNECQKLPNKAFKVKRNINETMVFLHLLYSDLHEPLENGFYHEKMAEVMAMYLDLEITAFRRGKDTAREVYNRLSSRLYTLLDRSDDYILDALLRTQLVNKHSKKLCGPFLRKVLTELVVRRPLSALTYVRYLLTFKLWKNVVAEANEKKVINKIALQRLHPPPKFFQDHDIAKPLAKILPKVPKKKENSSQFYLQKKFNLKDACRAFLRFCKESNCQEEPVYLPTFSEKADDVEDNGCLSLINDIWPTLSKDASDNMPLLGKSDVFSEDRMFCDDTSMCERDEVFVQSEEKSQVESPDSGVCLDEKAKNKRKRSTEGGRDKVPDSAFVVYPECQEVRSGGNESTDVDGSVAETISEAASPESSSTMSVPAVDENQGCSYSSSLHLPNEATKKEAMEPVKSEANLPTPPPPVSGLISEGDDVDVKIKSECAQELELPSSRRPQQYSSANKVAVEVKADTPTYQDVLPSEDLAELEWRRYSDALGKHKPSLDLSLEEQVTEDADGGRNHHSSSNCHLPLKKRKLAASTPNELQVLKGSLKESEVSREDLVGQWDLQESPIDTRWCQEKKSTERVTYVERRCNLDESPVVSNLDGQVSAEVPDNLKILAEEAAKIWEEREQGTTCQVPYGVYSLQTGAFDVKASFIPAYSAGRMMSLAEALVRQSPKTVEESVIVRNYQCFKEEANSKRVTPTQYHASRHEANNESVVRNVVRNGVHNGVHKPIDMSGKSKDSILPYSRNLCDKSSSCSNCQSLRCDGKCRVERTCQSQSCNGKECKVVSRSKPHVGVSPLNSTCDINKCCSCTSESNACRPSKSVCQYCKKSGCDSRCWHATCERSKKCNSCQPSTCKGKCKADQNSTNRKSQGHEVQSYPSIANFAKCHYCKSTCFGTCRLAEKQQSLENAKSKGKCSAVCSHCSQKKCSGACRIQHSVDSILGSSSNETSSRSNRRRTRNSVQSKARTTVEDASEPKRGKKSVSR